MSLHRVELRGKTRYKTTEQSLEPSEQSRNELINLGIEDPHRKKKETTRHCEASDKRAHKHVSSREKNQT